LVHLDGHRDDPVVLGVGDAAFDRPRGRRQPIGALGAAGQRRQGEQGTTLDKEASIAVMGHEGSSEGKGRRALEKRASAAPTRMGREASKRSAAATRAGFWATIPSRMAGSSGKAPAMSRPVRRACAGAPRVVARWAARGSTGSSAAFILLCAGALGLPCAGCAGAAVSTEPRIPTVTIPPVPRTKGPRPAARPRAPAEAPAAVARLVGQWVGRRRGEPERLRLSIDADGSFAAE